MPRVYKDKGEEGLYKSMSVSMTELDYARLLKAAERTGKKKAILVRELMLAGLGDLEAEALIEGEAS